ncbi:DNA polymerase III subunit gamma/tau [Pseudobutyrivibrio xylanivorans]|uniref:DNA-directed DNA polymerase n=1 Tax=Pseudobutyrivibrio xylanivorans TaxID=185007 RepID=A0A5P6VN44_PSEXY|nr:DNA polymerase III subunit gamma/tau [Pseudobutyrivibrio xylanivorans]QFJ54083.1 DNA polymerase III subunit gamma/tau [Pseudobutyrivibrio xylanivorans]
MSYMALYRKFRPQVFSDVKGQDHIVTTLQNQIKTNRIGHAYLFTGTRGTGKTTVAKILARTINCSNPKEDGSPCMECESCMAISSDNSMDVREIDAASNNGVDSIRQIVEEVKYTPQLGKYKVYIIDEVHMLSIGAFNALLKTLEEPPSYVVFILATTEVHKIPITILSRCQRYDFHRISIDTIAARLQELMDKEGVQVEDKAIRYVAKAADGSMRDGLSLLDQCIAFYIDQPLTYDNVLKVLGAIDTEVFSRLLRFIVNGQITECIGVIEEIMTQGRDLNQFVNDFTWYLRNLMLLKSSDDMEDVLEMSSDNIALLKEEAKLVDTEVLMRYIQVLSALSNDIKYASQKRVLIEIALIKLCKPQMEADISALNNRIANLEKKVEEGVPVVMAAPIAGSAPAPSSAPVKKEPLPAAIPEEVKQVAQNWSTILGKVPVNIKMYLKEATTRTVNEAGELVLIFDQQDGSERMAGDFVNRPEVIEEINKAIEATIQKTVNVKVEINSSGISSKQTRTDAVDYFASMGIEIEQDQD